MADPILLDLSGTTVRIDPPATDQTDWLKFQFMSPAGTDPFGETVLIPTATMEFYVHRDAAMNFANNILVAASRDISKLMGIEP